MKTIFVLFLFVLIAAGQTVLDTQESAQNIALPDTLPMDQAIIYGKMENGLTYYIRQNHKPEKRAELRLVVNAGSILEKDNQQGLAHFLEHMAFNGTEHFAKQDLVNYLEDIGMRFGPDINAYTSFDETVFMLQVPTDSTEIMEKAFLILSDWAHAISLEDDEIDKERGVVIEEWRLGRGASARIRDKQFPVLLYDSRYAERLPIGKKAVLDSFAHQSVRNFYHDWYRPDLMALVAVGDFDPGRIETLIKNNFSHLHNPADERVRKLYPVPDHTETLFSAVSDSEATYSRVSVYKKLPVRHNLTTADYRSQLIKTLYNRMLNERLSELTRSENPPFLYAVSREGRMIRTKNFYILSAVVKDNGIPRGLDALLTEARRIKMYGFTATELERQKAALLRAREQQFNERDKTESSSFAAQYASSFLYDNSLPSITFRYELDKRFLPGIRLDEVDQLAKEWMSDDSRVILADAPEKKGLKLPDKTELAGVLTSVQNKQIDPYIDEAPAQPLLGIIPGGGKIESEEYEQNLDLHIWKLSNGIRVISKQTDFKNDEVRMSAFSPGGTSLVADSLLVAAETATGTILESGIGQFNRTQLQKYLTGRIVRVSPYLGELSEGFSGFASPKDLETMFQLIYLYFMEPRIDSTAFNAFRERLMAIYKNRSASPEAAFYDTLTATLTQNNPRYKPWTVKTLSEMDAEKSLKIFRDRFADAGDFTFIFVGNFAADSLKYMVQTYLAGLPDLKRHENWKDRTYRYPHGVISKKVYKGIEPKSRTEIVITGPFQWNRKERYICGSMMQMLQIKLRERLREDLSGTYSISAGSSFDHYPLERYQLSFSFGCDPRRTDELTAEIFTQIDSLKNFAMKESYLEKIKEIELREYETDLKKNDFWISNLEYKYFNQEPVEDILDYPEMVRQLSMKEVQTAGQKFLDVNNFIKVVLLPENKKFTTE